MLKCDLVLEGGGVKGIALVGAVDVLQERGYEVQRVAGTSAGAITGALVAAGIAPAERRALLRDLDWERFKDRSLLDRLPGGELLSLLREHGIYEGDYLRSWLAEQLAGQGVRTFADLPRLDPGDDPGGLAHRLVVFTSDLTDGLLRALPADYPDIGVPDGAAVPVADAVRASASIPYFFEPVRLPRPGRDPVVLVDGGLLSNFPITAFDRTDGKPPRWPTFGIKLSLDAGSQAGRGADDSLLGFTRALVHTLLSFYDQMHLSGAGVRARTMFVDTFGVSPVDFDLSAATRVQLYEAGRAAAEQFLATWDWDAYVAEYRT